MGALGAREVEHESERVQHARRRRDVPSLLKPRVPGQADPGELGDLLAPQSRSASASAAVGESQCMRRGALAEVTQELGELLATDVLS